MRHKLALTIALAGFALATALGVGMAGAEPKSGLGQSQTLDPAAALPTSPNPEATACANEADDDGDGQIDLDDADCESASDPDEAPAPAPAPGAEEAQTGEELPTSGVESGSSLDAEDATSGGNGVSQNEGVSASPETAGGGVSAPRATAGDQPPATGPSGGSQFGDGGVPSEANPSTTIAPFGPAPIGVPNFVIDSFEIPPFLLPIYQACGTEYGIPWEILASINKIETGFGTNLNVSSAGAMGWMQFIPSSWEAYGLDANGDGRKDPYNPVDAICAAASYLKAAGGTEDLYGAIFAYNHADWYVDEVLLYARGYGKLPDDLVSSLTGLTEGA
ncbi:MAG TPA: lytic transglycosylase domain-containing protein, partial [Solirubrobacterales bacterium]|nr:lytic transglycosylase domain-containing protein [Solirubrobacterales bacterium]